MTHKKLMSGPHRFESWKKDNGPVVVACAAELIVAVLLANGINGFWTSGNFACSQAMLDCSSLFVAMMI